MAYRDEEFMERRADEMRRRAKAYGSLGIVAVVLVVAAVLLLNSFFTVDAGERAVVLRFGAVKGTAAEGLHFKAPFIDSVVKIDVRVTKAETETESSSKDLQVVRSEIALNYHPDADNVGEIYKDIGLKWEERVVDPAVKETFKAITAGYTAEELITRRAEVSDAIRQDLSEKLAKYHLIVEALSITDFAFSKQFNAAIEAKQIAEQQALKAQRDLQRIKLEAEQSVTRAKAEAEALRIQKQEVTEQLLRLREIEVQKAAVEKWDGKLPDVTGGAMPFIQVKQGK
ncbi:MAG TPA: prohibitin family protein [Candidatus Saccharimonadales bacterium]|nr:prohibitin family protein [Candidatus Saccharimonadales bacterium]